MAELKQDPFCWSSIESMDPHRIIPGTKLCWNGAEESLMTLL